MQLDPQLMARMLMQAPQQQPDQQLFQAPPMQQNMAPVIDPRIWRDPNTLPGDYARLPYQQLPPGMFGQ